MPFDATHKVVYGADARGPRTWAATTFIAWLSATLNDEDGPYAAALGVTPQRQVIVTDNRVVATSLFSGDKLPPVVLVGDGPLESHFTSRNINGVNYEGQRNMLQFKLDMGVNDRGDVPNAEEATIEEIESALDAIRNEDRSLSDFVCDAVKRGLPELDALGLLNTEITPDAANQAAGNGRNPHDLTLFVISLDDYTPA